MRRFIPVSLIVAAGLVAFAGVPPTVEAGGGGHGSCVPAPRDGVNEPIVIEGTCFEPAVLYVPPATTAEWQQRDVIPHNVTLFDGEVVGGKASLVKGETVSFQFERPGVYAYYCSIHPSMVGMVVVGDPASPAFGASLELRTAVEQLQAIADYKQEWLDGFKETTGATANAPAPAPADAAASIKGKGSLPGGAGWGEAVVGMGLFAGLLVGLVAAGGGLKLRRR